MLILGGSINSVDPGWINDQHLMITVEMIAVETIASCVDPGEGVNQQC